MPLFKSPIKSAPASNASTVNGKQEDQLSVASAVNSTNAENADTLDTYHASEFATSGHTHTDLLSDAPEDAVTYGRYNKTWVSVQRELGFDDLSLAKELFTIQSMSINTPPEFSVVNDIYILSDQGETGTAWEGFASGKMIYYADDNQWYVWGLRV